MRTLLLIVAFSSSSVAAGPVTTLAHLPYSTVTAAQTDAAGNIYIAGYQGIYPATDAFVARLNSAGTVVYSTTFAGRSTDQAEAIAVDSAGAAYIIGVTQSTDFPVTPGALQTTFQAVSPGVQGFAAKVDANGKVVYATFIGGSSNIDLTASGLAVDSAGEAILSGQTLEGVFPTTAGAPVSSTDSAAGFVMKLDPTGGKLLGAIRGIGGHLALDGLGNVYLAGTAPNPPTPIPITPGAFQNTFQARACGGDAQLAFSCSYQYVTKLTASLTQVVYSTYLTGSYGATPAAISVDSAGNAFVAGTTNSPDYPTTSNAFEPIYIAAAPAPLQTCLFFCIFPPPASGYLTQLNASGTGLVYSTYFSGTQTDTISFAAFTANGVYLSGSAGSPDLPGFDGFPSPCLPQTYAAMMSADATETGAARAVPGSILAYYAAAGALLAWTGPDLVAFDLRAPPLPIACILDSADLKPVTSIAPGELLTIFGQHLSGSVITQASRGFATSLDGISVAINGIGSPLLYVGPQQINLQAPFEIAGAAQANIAFANTQLNASDARTLPIVAGNPVAFLDTVTQLSSLTNCLNSLGYVNGGNLPLAFNADGTRNACTNPAAPGALVTLFLAGLGVTSPPEITGAITPYPGAPLSLTIGVTADGQPAAVAAAAALAGSISGIWQVAIRLPANLTGALPLSISVSGVPVRDSELLVWAK